MPNGYYVDNAFPCRYNMTQMFREGEREHKHTCNVGLDFMSKNPGQILHNIVVIFHITRLFLRFLNFVPICSGIVCFSFITTEENCINISVSGKKQSDIFLEVL